MREEFLRSAADQLKTPVTSLGLTLQRMENVRTEEERRVFFEMTKRGQRELERTVTDLLGTARKESMKDLQ